MADLTGVEAELRANGISVERVDAGEPLSVAYLTAFPGDSVHRREVGRACNALLDLARAGDWDPVRVEATVLRADADVLGTWHAEAEWFEALLAEEITETEFSTRVVGTLGTGEPDDDRTEGTE